ncbi:MAG: PAS domain-containing protein [Coleofasciculaceae cyanobacterium]
MNSNKTLVTFADILVVDDTPNNLRLLAGMLSEQGYKVRKVINGVLALQAVKVAPPDLILLDINMPGMNGYEVCQRLKDDPKTAQIPVIFISALDQVIDKVKAFEVGGVDYITKPFKLPELIARIENQLKICFLQNQLKQQNERLKEEVAVRKKTEAALRLSEEKFCKAFRACPDPMSIATLKDGRYIEVNDSCLEIAGYSREQMLGHTVFELNFWLNPEDRLKLSQQLQAEKAVRNQEFNLRSKSGQVKTVLLSAELIEINGETCILTITRDITERKCIEEALRKSEERWHLALRGNNDGIWDWNLETNKIFYSSRWKEMLGYQEAEITNNVEEWKKRINPDDAGLVIGLVRAHLAGTTPYYIAEYRLRTKDGNYKWILDRGQALWDEQGKPVRLVGSHTDISERKQREEALQLIVEGTAATTGKEFFRSCTRYLAQVLQVRYAMVCQLTDETKTKVRSLALWTGEQFSENVEYQLAGTPCEQIKHGSIFYCQSKVQERFPEDKFLVEAAIESYLGIPLIDSTGEVIGLLAVMDCSPLKNNSDKESILRIFAARAEAELERQLSEEALRRSEERWDLVLRGNNDGIWDWNIETGETTRSPRWKQMLGYQDEEIADTNDEWTSRLHRDDVERVMAARWDYLNKVTSHYAVEHRLRSKDGNYRWVLSRGQALWDENGKPVRMVGSTRDITERKLAEEKLRKSEASLAAAQRVAHVGSWEFDLKTRKITWSEELFHIFGFELQQAEPSYTQYFRRIYQDDRSLLRKTFEQIILTGKPDELDYRIVRPDGSIRYLTGRGEAVTNKEGQIVYLFGTAMDITERKQTEVALQDSEKRARENASKLKSTLERLKRTQTQLVQNEKMSSLGQMLAGVAHEINNPVSFIYGNLSFANQYFQEIIGLIKTYQQTCQHPAPEVRELTENIDLDFLLKDWHKLMNSMQVGAERIQEIVLSLRNFSRVDGSEVKSVDIHQGIENTLLLLQHRLKAVGDRPETKIIKEYSQLPPVTCYVGQLNQVFMNLLSNAIDALENAPAPREIIIRTEVKTEQANHREEREQVDQKTDEKQIILSPHHNCRDYPDSLIPSIIISIADNGSGITQEVLHQIFDPFFTTKPVGSGTGLGLSISYQIVVEKHGGTLSCISEIGQGTEFVIEIPLVAKPLN